MFERLSRLRRTEGLRALFAEIAVRRADLVQPIFVQETAMAPVPIEAMPGQVRFPLESLPALGRALTEAGVRAALLFGLPARKSDDGSSACDPDGIVPQAVRRLKEAAPELTVITDVCVCSFTSHGHCGLMREGRLENDATLDLLAETARVHAQAGADLVAPSAMMDGQVAAIRARLDASGFSQTGILGYSAKFASAFYGPFREAADSAPTYGDRSAYQHDARNVRHARRELLADMDEGADALMVKPGLAYLDVLAEARRITDLPLAAYMVSGEYAMLKAAAERGWLDERATVLEVLTAFKRAGADLIVTYYAQEAAAWLDS